MEAAESSSLSSSRSRSFVFHQTVALSLTFLSYSSFHAARKAPSITKSVLASSWAPFTDPVSGPHLLALMDLAFLASYSVSMLLVAGPIADRLPLRPLLLAASVLSALLSLSFSVIPLLRLHSLPIFLLASLLSGLFHSFAWPCVLPVAANWSAASPSKGLILGLWNSHTSVGNILGSVLSSAVLDYGWGYAYAVTAFWIIVVAVVVYLLLEVSPKEAGFEVIKNETETETEVEMGEREDAGLLLGETEVELERAIGFAEAWRLPGVAPFAACLFFSKLVAYTFLYWLPFYIQRHGEFLDSVYLFDYLSSYDDRDA